MGPVPLFAIAIPIDVKDKNRNPPYNVNSTS